jgi:SprA-related family
MQVGSLRARQYGETTVTNPAKDPKILETIAKLSARDSDVKSHEMAHKAVGGSLAGSISYEYQAGPDGKQYAVGGEVPIDLSAESDPKATEAKMRQARAAALAPANPSPQDIKVAGSATMLEMKAKMDELKNQEKETKQTSKQKAIEAYTNNMPQDTTKG